jgi:WD40 repeat protein/mono/diheme cytochrome c family protein
MIRSILSNAAIVLLLLGFAPPSISQEKPLDPASAARISYRRDVAPILKRHCISCHTRNDPQGELNMDTVKLFATGGKKGAALTPGKPDESLAIQMVTGVKKPVMPHKQPPLSTAKIDTLRRWILAGAKDDSEPLTTVERIVIPKSYKSAPAVTSVAFSPDGKLLAAACRSEIVVLSVDGKLPPQRLPTESDLLTCVTFSPDGQTLAGVGGSPALYGEVRFFQVAEPAFKLRSARKIGKDTFFRGGFSPDGRTLAVGGADGAVYLVPVDDKVEVRKYDLHSDWVSAVTFSVDGRLLISGSRDRTIKVAMADSGKMLRSIATSPDQVNAVAATATLAISAGRDRVPAVYDLKLSLGAVVLKGNGNEAIPDSPAAQYTRKLEGQGGEVLDLGIDAKRTKLAVAGVSSEARIYSLPAGGRLATLTPVPSPVYCIALSADGTRAATGSYNGQVGIYDAATGKLLKQLVPVPVE